MSASLERLANLNQVLLLIEKLVALRKESIPLDEIEEAASEAKKALRELSEKPDLCPYELGHCRICGAKLGLIEVIHGLTQTPWCIACSSPAKYAVHKLCAILNGQTKDFESKLQKMVEEKDGEWAAKHSEEKSPRSSGIFSRLKFWRKQ